MLTKNYALLLKKTSRNAGVMLIVFIGTAAVLGKIGWILSSLLSFTISGVSLFNAMKAQMTVLSKKNHGAFFVHYLSRMALSAVPIVLWIYFRNLLNLYVILVFLFCFQINLVLIQWMKSAKSL